MYTIEKTVLPSPKMTVFFHKSCTVM